MQQTNYQPSMQKQASCFKLWINFKDKNQIDQYSWYNEIVRDPGERWNMKWGFEALINQVEKRYAGKFITAVIYDLITNLPLRKKVGVKEWEVYVVPLFNENRFNDAGDKSNNLTKANVFYAGYQPAGRETIYPVDKNKISEKIIFHKHHRATLIEKHFGAKKHSQIYLNPETGVLYKENVK